MHEHQVCTIPVSALRNDDPLAPDAVAVRGDPSSHLWAEQHTLFTLSPPFLHGMGWKQRIPALPLETADPRASMEVQGRVFPEEGEAVRGLGGAQSTPTRTRRGPFAPVCALGTACWPTADPLSELALAR